MEDRQQASYAPFVIIGLLLASVVVSGFNTYHVSQMQDTMDSMGSKSVSSSLSTQTAQRSAPAPTQRAVSSDAQARLPTGEPEFYGKEIGVRYDDVRADNPQLADATIAKLSKLDRSIQLDDEQNARYVDILTKQHKGISCEYCCGAPSIIFANGAPACGCAHSFAMRGVAKYMITEYGSEVTDEQIFEEMSKWKMTFFPTQMSQKADVLESKGVEASFTNMASNEYRGIQSGSSSGGSGMVGGC